MTAPLAVIRPVVSLHDGCPQQHGGPRAMACPDHGPFPLVVEVLGSNDPAQALALPEHD
jgi:hypothetical protein